MADLVKDISLTEEPGPEFISLKYHISHHCFAYGADAERGPPHFGTDAEREPPHFGADAERELPHFGTRICSINKCQITPTNLFFFF